MRLILFGLLVGLFSLTSACSSTASSEGETTSAEEVVDEMVQPDPKGFPDLPPTDGFALATFAGGCFWCTEAALEQLKGVGPVLSGYADGERERPTYREVSSGATQYAEAVRVYYDSTQIDYRTLVEAYFTSINPTQANGQGPDIGSQYRPAIYYHNARQREIAEAYIEEISPQYDQPIAVTVEPQTTFYTAENYHQDFYWKNPRQGYIVRYAVPKVQKIRKQFSDRVKAER